MHFEVWLETGEDVWATMIDYSDNMEEALSFYHDACNKYGKENVDIVKVDEDDRIYPIDVII